jgi:hypothetical protein
MVFSFALNGDAEKSRCAHLHAVSEAVYRTVDRASRVAEIHPICGHHDDRGIIQERCWRAHINSVDGVSAAPAANYARIWGSCGRDLVESQYQCRDVIFSSPTVTTPSECPQRAHPKWRPEIAWRAELADNRRARASRCDQLVHRSIAPAPAVRPLTTQKLRNSSSAWLFIRSLIARSNDLVGPYLLAQLGVMAVIYRDIDQGRTR